MLLQTHTDLRERNFNCDQTNQVRERFTFSGTQDWNPLPGVTRMTAGQRSICYKHITATPAHSNSSKQPGHHKTTSCLNRCPVSSLMTDGLQTVFNISDLQINSMLDWGLLLNQPQFGLFDWLTTRFLPSLFQPGLQSRAVPLVPLRVDV